MYYLRRHRVTEPLTDEELALYPHRNDDPFILRIRADQIAIDALQSYIVALDAYIKEVENA